MGLLATERFSEVFTPLGQVSPISSAAANSSSWVNVADMARIVAIIQTGLIAATGTFDAKLEQATSSGGAGAKDITGKAITQLADTGDNKNLVIDCRADELDVNGGFKFVRLTLTGATAATVMAGILLGTPAYKPGVQTNWTQAIN